ncbi:WD repeat-containing protein RUP2-like [Oryza brachyantha]|uniref:WD repeat-containing protein RUP2-like n=1 Tax=Oryza brachyantha TaxID=4533 RepID=UPI001ADA17DE|nr:WD repeat-containing protein RUP2-like [Oryza brachyantha]
MSNPSSPATATAGEQHDQDQGLQAPDEHSAAGIIPDDEDKLSPPRCEWEFRLAATVPSPALAGASDTIGSVDFDPTGRHLATGGIARKIRVYRAAEPSSPAGCICVPAKLSSVRWRPAAGEAAVAHVGCGDYDGVVTEYDVERGVPVWERDEHEGRRVWALDYAGGGAAMVASGSDDRTAHVWDPRAPAGTTGWATARAGGAVLCVEFDPAGGPQLAVGSADRRAVVYDVRALGRGAVASMDGHGRAVTYVRWALPAAARRVVTSAADGTHRLWALQAEAAEEGWSCPAREVRSYSGHVSGRSFVGMGVWRGAGLIASGSESGHVFVYDLRWSKPIWVHPFAAAFVTAVAWRQAVDNDDGDGHLVAGGSDGVLKLFTCHRRLSSDVAAGDDDDDVTAC